MLAKKSSEKKKILWGLKTLKPQVVATAGCRLLFIVVNVVVVVLVVDEQSKENQHDSHVLLESGRL